MLSLTFNQKVALGFVIIIVLLSISGVSSLWNLNDIDNSNARINESAVPMVQRANQVQIQVLKLANLSALGFNAYQEEDIRPYRENFEKGMMEFSALYDDLYLVSKHDSAVLPLVSDIKKNYDSYTISVQEMFDAKLAALLAKQHVADEVAETMDLVSLVGAALMDIVFLEAPEEFSEDAEIAAGIANEVDGKMVGVIKLAQELQRATDIARLQTGLDDFAYTIDEAILFFDRAAKIFKPMDEKGSVNIVYARMKDLKANLSAKNNLVSYKKEQLSQAEIAIQKLESASTTVNQAVSDLDSLLSSANTQFGLLQSTLNSSLSFGFRSTVVILIVLMVIATQNFNSMRHAIRKKMLDLAKLNQIGGSLAAARDQDSALNEVLNALHEKTGLEKGSVYLFNKQNALEAKAFLPATEIKNERKALTFTKGEGVIGRVAEKKKVVFVPDTSRDKQYVANEGEAPKALLCIPLIDKEMLIGVMNFSGDVKNVNFADSDYEFASSVSLSLVTTINNIQMVEVIEEHSRSLERKVEERTLELKQKIDDIANMLSNMHQGLFTIIEGGLIHPEYAAYLETIFETKSIANRNFVDLLFGQSNISADALDSVNTAVASIVGEDEMMFEFNSHLLVSDISITLKEGRNKLIELDWDPIVDDTDTVTKLMVTVRDVTELKALESEAAEQRQELSMIGEILAIDQDKFDKFLTESQSFIDTCRGIIEATPTKDQAKIAELFRNIHTVKGNARTYGLSSITDTVHGIENTYDLLRKQEDMPWQPEQLLEELQQADTALQKYRHIFKDTLGNDGETGSAQLDKQEVERLLSMISNISGETLPNKVVDIVEEAYQTFVSIEAKPISVVIADVINSVTSLAAQLDKAEPDITVNDGGVFIRSEAHSMLNNIFMHVLRNALDHGIENREDRLKKGKSEQGSIEINTSIENDLVNFSIHDDGKGIALTRIYQKAIESGLYAADAPRPPAAEIANLIFASGFSTAEAVTDVSGRGVGMDAVRQFLLSNGGSIEVVLSEGGELDDFRGFTTIIRLPKELYLLPPVFAKAAGF